MKAKKKPKLVVEMLLGHVSKLHFSSPWIALVPGLRKRLDQKEEDTALICYPMFPDAPSPEQSKHEVFLPERKVVSLADHVMEWMRDFDAVKSVVLVNLNLLFGKPFGRGLLKESMKGIFTIRRKKQ